MTSSELAYYRQTRLGQLHRLLRLIDTYGDDLNPLGLRMLLRASVAVTTDYFEAVQRAPSGPTNISSAPPPPAEPSPEGSG